MKSVYQRGEQLPTYLLQHDVEVVQLRDGRRVVISGLELANNTGKTMLELAQEKAYDEERRPPLKHEREKTVSLACARLTIVPTPRFSSKASTSPASHSGVLVSSLPRPSTSKS